VRIHLCASKVFVGQITDRVEVVQIAQHIIERRLVPDLAGATIEVLLGVHGEVKEKSIRRDAVVCSEEQKDSTGEYGVGKARKMGSKAAG
jgi:hypothetical protein